MANSRAERHMLGEDRMVTFAEALQNNAVRHVIVDAVQLSAALSPSAREQVGMHLLGMVLSLCAGMANAIAFAQFHVYVSNVSGPCTAIGLRTEKEQKGGVPTPVELLVCFIFGAVLAGMIIPGNTIKLGQARYELVLFLVAVMELACWCHELRYPQMLAAAMGLQNAMITSWSGAVMRTTHITGTATDLGSALGRIISRCIRRRCQLGEYSNEDWDQHMAVRKKFVLMTCLLISCIAGCVVGAAGYRAFKLHSLLIPAGLTGILGAMHVLYCIIHCEEVAEEKMAEHIMRHSTSSSTMPHDLVDDPEKMAQLEQIIQTPAMQFIRQISCKKARL